MQAPPFVVSLATTPTASLIAKTLATQPAQETALPTPTPPQPEASALEPVRIQSKEPSLMSKLQVPDKEATVRFAVDMSEFLHRKLSMLAAKTGRKKVDIVRVLLEDGLKETDG
ncbi:CopG family transcriptional regulator [Microcoleus asticus]|nr:CopG family transcriptional regulator [Microcoleus asticus]